MNLWHDLEPGTAFPGVCTVVVEVAMGGANTYRFHYQTGAIKLDRARYPGHYGLVPQTLDVDGQPINVLVMTNLPTFPGCIIEARPIGLFQMLCGNTRDDKLLAVMMNDPFFAGYQQYTDLPPHHLREIEQFFTIANHPERTHVTPIGWQAAGAARSYLCVGNRAFWECRTRQAVGVDDVRRRKYA